MARTIKRSAIVPYSAQQMFDLVNDIDAYSEFIPNCQRSEVLSRDGNIVTAELTLGKAGIAQTFSTRNTLQEPTEMTLSLISGPFKRFDGEWQFKPLNNGCAIDFTLVFDFASKLLNLTAGKFIESVATEQVDVMCRRAEQIYGPQS